MVFYFIKSETQQLKTNWNRSNNQKQIRILVILTILQLFDH